jgi:hypothetical protein
MRSRLLFAACLLTLALPAVTAASKQPKPQVETRTYQLQVIISGHYAQSLTFGEADGYCNGTGQALSASFHVVSTAKLRVKLDTDKATTAVPVVDDANDNDWQIDNAFVRDGDTCDQVEKSTCHGSVLLDHTNSVPDHAYAKGIGHRVLFGTDFESALALQHSPADCRADEQIGPPVDFSGVTPVTSPYDVATLGVKLVKLNELKKGKSYKRTYKPPKGTADADSAVAACNNTPGCTASLTSFVHTISIKRLK